MNGGLVKSVLHFNQKFPFLVYLHGTEDWPQQEDFFQAFSMGHGMVVQRVELMNTISLLRQSLLFLPRYFLLWKLSSEMFLTKCSVQWYLLRILMGNCWKGKMRKIWPRMVKSHKKADFRCFWQSAANWIFVLNKSRFSNFLKAGVCIHIFANKSSVSICISVFIS